MIIQGDALTELKKLPSDSVDCCVTSPPYYQLRDYGVVGQIGLEETVEEYINKLVAIFREVKRVLRPDGTLWVNNRIVTREAAKARATIRKTRLNTSREATKGYSVQS